MTDLILTELKALYTVLVPMLLTGIATAIIEVIFWYLCRFKNLKFLLFVALINVISNFFINYAFLYIVQKPVNIFCGEIIVILTEYILILYYLRTESKIKILFLTFISNMLSYTIGFIYFGIFS